MPADKQTATGTLDERTDENGHITPHSDPEQRALDIDEQVRRAREGEVSVGHYDVEPGVYGEDAIAKSNTQILPQDDGQTQAEAEARSKAIDAQVEAARTGGLAATAITTGTADSGSSEPHALPGSQLAKEAPVLDDDHADAGTHDAQGHDLRPDPQAGAVAEAKAEEAQDYNALTVPELKAIAAKRDVKVDGRTKADYVKALEASDAE